MNELITNIHHIYSNEINKKLLFIFISFRFLYLNNSLFCSAAAAAGASALCIFVFRRENILFQLHELIFQFEKLKFHSGH